MVRLGAINVSRYSSEARGGASYTIGYGNGRQLCRAITVDCEGWCSITGDGFDRKEDSHDIMRGKLRAPSRGWGI